MKMTKKTLDCLELKGKKALIKVDFNVPIENGVITSNKRIVEALPTIKRAINEGAKVILFSHLGRVESETDKLENDIRIAAVELEKLLGKPVQFVNATMGAELESAINSMNDGDVLMFQNTRWEDAEGKKESKNNPELGKYWASLGDVFINDAFGAAHRGHASNVGISAHIKESAVGLLMEKELAMLSKALYDAKQPIVSIIGGAKVSDKISVIENLLEISDKVIIGGAMAYTFSKAKGFDTGKSRVEEDHVSTAEKLMKKGGDKLVLPIDHVTTKEFADVKGTVRPIEENPEDEMGLDIGPKTIELFGDVIKKAGTVIWNGPMGVFEFKNYSNGTESIARIITKVPGVFSVIGGGDSAAAAINLGFEKDFSHISTGGGASLEFMEGKELPGVAAIQDADCKKECGCK